MTHEPDVHGIETLLRDLAPLSPSSAFALTLRAVGGLTTPEIARAFFVPEATMAQRISRAKQQIKRSRVAFRPPSRLDRAERLALVLHVLYLIFNEGYASTAGEEVHRVELSAEAIRLARILQRLLPDDPEVTGLLALMLLTDARRAARMDARGDVVPLDQRRERTCSSAPATPLRREPTSPAPTSPSRSSSC